jgi:hypothetical protein
MHQTDMCEVFFFDNNMCEVLKRAGVFHKAYVMYFHQTGLAMPLPINTSFMLKF